MELSCEYTVEVKGVDLCFFPLLSGGMGGAWKERLILLWTALNSGVGW